MEEDPKTRILRLAAFQYLHILNRNTNTTRLEVGPKNFVCQEHERVVLGPEKMLVILPRHYCVIADPVVRVTEGKDGKQEVKEDKQDEKGVVPAYLKGVVFDEFGQVKLRHGETEIRFESEEPFPLFPGEKLKEKMVPLSLIDANAALHLRATRTFIDKFSSDKPVKRVAGEEWLLEGPRTYFPQVEVTIKASLTATITKANQAIKVRAKRNCLDYQNNKRRAGDMWLIRKEGSYLPGIDEELVEVVNGIILTDKKALQLKALKTFTDVYGKERKAGESWLVTNNETEVHIPDVYEQMIRELPLISLTSRQFCIIQNPWGEEEGKPLWGQRKLIKGETHFFLKPGEVLEASKDIYVLGEEEALEVFCLKDFEENLGGGGGGNPLKRIAGQTYLIYGPRNYIPPLQVQVNQKRKAVIQIEALGLYYLFK